MSLTKTYYVCDGLKWLGPPWRRSPSSSRRRYNGKLAQSHRPLAPSVVVDRNSDDCGRPPGVGRGIISSRTIYIPLTTTILRRSVQRDEKPYILSETYAIYIYIIYMITKTAGTFILQKTSVDKESTRGKSLAFSPPSPYFTRFYRVYDNAISTFFNRLIPLYCCVRPHLGHIRIKPPKRILNVILT